ncbi:hypothetical protein ASE78_05740 [Sphingomonas sp. Leaf25]|nr:hypothetical protein ASE78_05740 [Sphingomonas sp. Leaf25]
MVAVFEEIADLSRINAGRVFCGYAHLAKITQLVDSTIAKALTVLEDLGMINRQRRFTKVARGGPKGQYRQTSNAYRTFLPKVIASFLPRWMKQKPISSDLAHHHAEQAAETERMLKSATCVEQMTYRAPESSDLRGELMRLAATVDRCDFENT